MGIYSQWKHCLKCIPNKNMNNTYSFVYFVVDLFFSLHFYRFRFYCFDMFVVDFLFWFAVWIFFTVCTCRMFLLLNFMIFNISPRIVPFCSSEWVHLCVSSIPNYIFFTFANHFLPAFYRIYNCFFLVRFWFLLLLLAARPVFEVYVRSLWYSSYTTFFLSWKNDLNNNSI